MFDFIHIGQAKCLSTMLQNRWSASSGYSFFHGVEIGDTISGMYLSGDTPAQPAQIAPEMTPGTVGVLSYECFTYFVADGETSMPPLSARVLDRQRYIARVLSGNSATALMILRDPIDWIRSVHAQYIKYGGKRDLQGYFEAARRDLLDNLDLAQMQAIWHAEGFDLRILPMEAYRHDKSGFWAGYEALLGHPAPEDRALADLADNRTEAAKLEPWVQANRIAAFLSAAMQGHQTYAAPSPAQAEEKRILTEAAERFSTWGIRRAFESMSADQLAELQALMQFRPDPGFRALRLDAEARILLETRYLAPLAQLPAFTPYLQRYRESLAAASGEGR